jgi:hypothetical protein
MVLWSRSGAKGNDIGLLASEIRQFSIQTGPWRHAMDRRQDEHSAWSSLSSCPNSRPTISKLRPLETRWDAKVCRFVVPTIVGNARFQPGSDRPAERSAWREKHDAEEAAQAAVVTAYATEMLPAILGGTWRKTNSQITVRKGQYYVEWPASYCRVLFDHPLHYRTSASLARRGKATWGNTVIVGRPYATFDEAGHLRDEAAQNAQDLAERFNVGVWARPDLSAWFPGSTALVIAARGIVPQNAAAFGFVPMCSWAPTKLMLSHNLRRKPYLCV